MSTYNKPKIISYHAQSDLEIAPSQQKAEFHRLLKELGFDNKLYMMSEKDVDGKLIKDVKGHGMDISFKAFLGKELPLLLASKFPIKAKQARQIMYPSEDLQYVFRENDKGTGIELAIFRTQKT